jgi:peroxiredoxin
MTSEALVGHGDPAPDAVLLDALGQDVRLSSFWGAAPTVIVFLRYFGCPFCQMHVVNLREDRERFERAGGTVLLIGQGDPAEGAGFCDRRHVPFQCLLDTRLDAFRAYGLKKARLTQVFGPTVAVPFVKANLRSETRQRGLAGGSFLQMPGTFLVDTSGTIRLAHRNRSIADSPRNQLILDAIAEVNRARIR